MNQQDRPTIDRCICSHSVQMVTIYHVNSDQVVMIWHLFEFCQWLHQTMIGFNHRHIILLLYAYGFNCTLPYLSKISNNLNLTNYDFLWIFSLWWLCQFSHLVTWALSACQIGNRICLWRKWFESECGFHPASKI